MVWRDEEWCASEKEGGIGGSGQVLGEDWVRVRVRLLEGVEGGAEDGGKRKEEEERAGEEVGRDGDDEFLGG